MGSKMSFIGKKLQDQKMGIGADAESPMEDNTPGDPIEEVNQKIDALTSMIQTMQDRMDQYWPDKAGEVGTGTNSTDSGMM